MTKYPQLWKRVLALAHSANDLRDKVTEVIDEAARMDSPPAAVKPRGRKRFYVVD